MKTIEKNTFLAVLSVAISSVAMAQSSQQPPALVVVVEVLQREVTASRTFVGTVYPHRASVVGSAVAGRVSEFSVNAGDWVTKGQPLAQLLTETINIELAAAKAELQLRQAELDELTNGALPEEIAQAKAELERSKALMDFALSHRKRTEKLFQTNGAATLEEFEESISADHAAQQNHLARKAAYNLVVEGPRAERIAQANARMQSQQQQVRLIESRIAKYTIRAPYDGYVVAEHTEVGQWVSQADNIAEVIDLETVELDVAVPEQYITHLRTGMTASVSLAALPGVTLQGNILQIIPQADLRSRTFPVKVALENPRRDGGHLLKAGMLAQVTLTVGQRQMALLVPKDSLVLGGRTPTVVAVATDKKTKQAIARIVPVKVGSAYDSLIQVSGDLRAGEQVVVQGNERLRPGQSLRVETAAPSTPAPSLP